MKFVENPSDTHFGAGFFKNLIKSFTDIFFNKWGDGSKCFTIFQRFDTGFT